MSSLRPRYRSELQRILLEEGRKQSWLAERTGIDGASLSHYVNGLHVPDDKRALIAVALGREMSDLFPEDSAAA